MSAYTVCAPTCKHVCVVRERGECVGEGLKERGMPMPERHKTGKWEEEEKENDFGIMIYLSQYVCILSLIESIFK